MASTVPDAVQVPISALQHYLFCKRQCALIHIEGAWAENYLTASGRVLHERIDRMSAETRRGVHLATALKLESSRLGLYGVADMVEFRLCQSAKDVDGSIVAAKLPRRDGFWRPFPVEYKRGAPKAHRADEVQLCAQATCLEEMLGVSIAAGALFYGETRRRSDVAFDAELRDLTERTALGARDLLEGGLTPPPEPTKACRACSLFEICRPENLAGCTSARAWLVRQIDKASEL